MTTTRYAQYSYLLAAFFLLFVTLQAHAARPVEILGIELTNGAQTQYVEDTSAYASIGTNGQAYIAGQNGRFLRFNITTITGTTIISQDLGELQSNFNINYRGSPSKGFVVPIPNLAEGRYVITAESYNESTGATAQTDTFNFVIDVTSPVPGNFISTGNNSYVLADGSGNTTLFGSTQTSAVGFEVTDLSGISSANVTVSYASGPQSGNVAWSGPATWNQAQGTLTIGTGTGTLDAMFPASRTTYNVTMLVTDLLGHNATFNHTVNFNDDCGVLPEPVAVHKILSTNQYLGQAAFTGFVPFTPGDSVFESPVDFVFRLPKTNWANQIQYGIKFDNVAYDDGTYVYQVANSSYRLAPSPTYGRFDSNTTYGCKAYNDLNAVYVAGVTTMAVQSVDISSPELGGYLGSREARSNQSFNVDKARVYVATKTFSQTVRIDGAGINGGAGATCTVAAGADNCEVTNLNWASGASGIGYQDATIAVEDSQGWGYGAAGGTARIHWDFNAPIVDTVVVNTIPATATVTAHDDDMTSPPLPGEWIMSSTGTLRLLSQADGTTYYDVISSSSASTGANSRQYNYSISTVPDGIYEAFGRVNDSYGNMGELSGGIISVDNTPPSVSMWSIKDGTEVLAAGRVKGFTDIQIRIEDTVDTTPTLISAHLAGGPDNVNMDLSLVQITDTTWEMPALEMYPSLTSVYTLTIVAEDDYGRQVTKNLIFQYIPNVLDINTSSGNPIAAIPAVAAPQKDTNGNEALFTEQLVDGTGAPLTGTMDVRIRNMDTSSIPLIVNGVRIDPDQEMTVTSYNFTTTGGKLELPMSAMTSQGAGNARIEIMVSLPEAPVHRLRVEVWEPNIGMDANYWSVFAVTQDWNATFMDTVNRCTLSIDAVDLALNNPIDNPQCRIVITGTPPEIEITEDAFTGQVKLQGRLFYSGSLAINYRVYIDGTDGTPYLMQTGSYSVMVNTPTDAIRFEPDTDLSSVFGEVENISATFRDTLGNVPCVYGYDTQSAINAVLQAEGDAVGCVFEWLSVPQGIRATGAGEEQHISGRVSLGDQTLTWRVRGYSKAGSMAILEEGSYTIGSTTPPPPTITFTPENQGVSGAAQVPIEGGIAGTIDISGYAARIRIEIKDDDTGVIYDQFDVSAMNRPGYDNPTVNARRRFAIRDRLDLWETVNATIHAHFIDVPASSSTLPIKIVGVPAKTIGPVITISDEDLEVLSTDPQTVTIFMEDDLLPGVPYDANTMGQWEVRVINQISYKDVAPVSDWKPIDASGAATFNMDFAGMQSSGYRLSAQARLVPGNPLALERLVVARRPIQIAILKGEAVEGEVTIAKYSGPAPFRTYLRLRLVERGDYLNIGNVTWEMRNLGETAWNEAVSDYVRPGNTLFVKQFQAGQYEIRAHVENKHSGVVFTTAITQVTAYHIPEIILDGPLVNFRYPDAPTSADFSLITRINGVVDDNVVLDWSTDGGATWTPGGPTYTLTVPTPLPEEKLAVTKPLWVRARVPEAPPEDYYSYKVYKTAVRFLPVRAPYIRLTGDYRVEVGQEHVYKATVYSPYRSMANEPIGEFVLPDGSTVSGTELTYTPTEEDLSDGSVQITYRAWIPGFEEYGATNERSFTSRTWMYIWPEFDLGSRIRFYYAPTQLSLYATQVGSRYYLDNPTYDWTLPPSGVTVNQSAYPDRRVVTITEPGTYDFSVTVSDARGNTTTESTQVTVDSPPPMSADMIFYKSNAYDREPLTVSMRAVASGGHPADSVVSLTYDVNGIPIESRGTYAQTTLNQGVHNIDLNIDTEFGESVTVSKALTVNPNQPPTCNLTMTEYSSSRYYAANCADTDGRMAGYQWFVEGNPVGLTGYRIAVSKGTYPDEPTVTVIGTDDSGADSPPSTLP